MNQSDRTLAYHLQAMKNLLAVVWPPQAPKSLGGSRGGQDSRIEAQQRHDLAEFPDRLNREYDPNQQAERVELRCPVCGRRNCPLDVRRRL